MHSTRHAQLNARSPVYNQQQADGRLTCGDALIGKRLFGLFQQAGFRDIQLSYQPELHVAGTPTFRLWIENILGIIEGASALLQAHQLATSADMRLASAELQNLLTRADASALFHWNRAVGVK